MLFSILNFIHFVYSLVTYWIRVVYILVFCSCFVSQSGKSTPLLGVPKKVTYRIMLESWCTTVSNTSSQHPLWSGICLFGRFYLNLAGSSAPKSHWWENLAPQHSILVKTFLVTFLGHPVCIIDSLQSRRPKMANFLLSWFLGELQLLSTVFDYNVYIKYRCFSVWILTSQMINRITGLVWSGNIFIDLPRDIHLPLCLLGNQARRDVHKTSSRLKINQ